jgi:mono/diheme cytochrome c family protein
MAWSRGLLKTCVALPLLMATPAMAQQSQQGPVRVADPVKPDIVKQGEYLARAGDCFSCHTKEGGALMAGGRQIQTPYGTIGSPNITPDKDTGIGHWSDDEFYRALHEGLDRNRSYLYPVMPFDHYTKVTREDALAIKAYLFSLPPVHAPDPESHLQFPYNIRTAMAGWRLLFFKPGTFKPDPSLSAQENRGAYLVEGLGHCGACHTPHNALGSSKQKDALGGGEIAGQGWFAPNISSDMREGVGGWSNEQLVSYLKTGVAPGRAIVAGPMSEVVHTSLQYLTDEDLLAIASYLKAAPGKALYAEKQLATPPGATEYLNHCSFCHQPDGKGIAGAVPALVGNGAVTAGGPEDVIRTILAGLPARGSFAPMPGMATTLSSAETANITNYVRTSWTNAAPTTATVSMVDKLVKSTSTMLSGTASCAIVGPPPLTEAILSRGIDPLLHQVNAANMLEQIDSILIRLQTPDIKVSQADLVNGLTSAYCPTALGDPSQPPKVRLELLQRFAGLVYTQLQHRPYHDAGTQHGAMPPAVKPN